MYNLSSNSLLFLILLLYGKFDSIQSKSHVISKAKPKEKVVLGTHHKTGTSFAFQTLKPLYKYINGNIGILAREEHFGDIATMFHGPKTDKLVGLDWLTNATKTPLAKVLGSKNKDIKFIHFVRDPLEMIISAYLYHLQKPQVEMWWLNSSGFITHLSDTDGMNNNIILKNILKKNQCPHILEDLSWLQVLQCLPQRDGLLVEAHKMIREVRDIWTFVYVDYLLFK